MIIDGKNLYDNHQDNDNSDSKYFLITVILAHTYTIGI